MKIKEMGTKVIQVALNMNDALIISNALDYLITDDKATAEDRKMATDIANLIADHVKTTYEFVE